ncbi:DUF937 domain-containing protein [Methylobacterium sp. C25]|uniref:DUF937 domain-containing protein n=1 Tax=Methylobacterium sp. C25 TaxID=2721622 RepID=UPI001F17EDD0|nr:DUF937 domain-containing protein [Methylobacterium sp. C25]MCE4224103.1 DUF937 domain-containing protein [Methylobacterium sp. C25]
MKSPDLPRSVRVRVPLMFNLFDILQNQAGPGMQTIGQQFGLTPEQSRSAMNALMPAIAAGLQRSAASDPMGFGRMLGMVSPDSYFAPTSKPQAPTQPDLLGQLFGSPMLSQAVLQQASAASGIGQQALRQMLPVMAGMVVAGIVHVLVNQPPPPPTPTQSRPAPPPPDQGFPMAAFWTDWINQFAGGSAPTPQTEKKPSSPTRDEPAPPKAPIIADEPAAEKTAKADGMDEAPFEAIQQMFQTGVQVQEQNAKAMQDIFDAFWSKPTEMPPADPAEAGVKTPDANEGQTTPESKIGGKQSGRRKGK